jgi:hypothetical protein
VTRGRAEELYCGSDGCSVVTNCTLSEIEAESQLPRGTVTAAGCLVPSDYSQQHCAMTTSMRLWLAYTIVTYSNIGAAGTASAT